MARVRVIAYTRGKHLRDIVMNITRKCFELKDKFPCFSWEFHNYKGKLMFTASHWSGDERETFEFPIHMVEVTEGYEYIMDQVDELKWSALFYEKEGEDG